MKKCDSHIFSVNDQVLTPLCDRPGCIVRTETRLVPYATGSVEKYYTIRVYMPSMRDDKFYEIAVDLREDEVRPMKKE